MGKRRKQPDFMSHEFVLDLCNRMNNAFVSTEEMHPVLAERGMSVKEFEKLRRRAKRGPKIAEAREELNTLYDTHLRRKAARS